MGKTITIYSDRLGESPGAGAGAGNKVTVHAVEIEDDYQKELKEIRMPKSKSNWSDDAVIYFIDLKKIRRAIKVTGWIAANASDDDDQVADDLRKIIGAGGVCKLNISEWNNGNDIDVQVLKCKIKESAADESTLSSTDRTRYLVELMCVEGEDI